LLEYKLKPLRSTFKRKVKKRVVSRSFRISPEIDRMMTEHARRKGWSKSFLIKEILVSWANYQKARAKVDDFPSEG